MRAREIREINKAEIYWRGKLEMFEIIIVCLEDIFSTAAVLFSFSIIFLESWLLFFFLLFFNKHFRAKIEINWNKILLVVFFTYLFFSSCCIPYCSCFKWSKAEKMRLFKMKRKISWFIYFFSERIIFSFSFMGKFESIFIFISSSQKYLGYFLLCLKCTFTNKNCQ